mgnify:CR=1 FL=1
MRAALCLNGKPAYPCPPAESHILRPCVFSLLQLCAVVGFFLLAARGAAGAVRIFLCVVFAADGVWKPVLYGGGKAGWFRTGTQWRKWLKNAGYWAFVGLLVAFFTYKGYNLIQMVRELAYEPYYLWQQDYVDGSAEMYEVDGVTIYVPTDRGQIGYNKFPSSPIVQDIELRGNSIRDGFRKKSK